MTPCEACRLQAAQPSTARPHRDLALEYAEPAVVGDPSAGDYSCFRCRTCRWRMVRSRAEGWRLVPPGDAPI